MSCQVKIDDTYYYIPCDRVSDLEMIDGYLVNLGSSSVTLKNNFSVSGTTYPYITCSSNAVCRYYSSNTQTYIGVTSEPIYEGDPFLTFNFSYLTCVLLLILIGVRCVWKK